MIASPRRAGVLLLGIGCLIALPVWQHGLAQPIRDRPADVPVLETEVITLSTDRQIARRLEAARDYLAEENWTQAFRLLQGILDAKEDFFIQVSRIGRDGAETLHWTSVRSEADRVLGSLSRDALELYQVLHGRQANALLKEARDKDDYARMDDIARRYFHTRAGAEALHHLATYHLDRGRPFLAALCFERLLRLDGPNEKRVNFPADLVTPLTLFKAAIAFHLTGDPAKKERVWKDLSAKAPDGLLFSGRKLSQDQLRDYLDRLPRESAGNWTVYRGNSSRSALNPGDTPFLEPTWQASTVERTESKRWIDQALRYQEQHSQATLPSFFPLLVTVRKNEASLPLLIYRSYRGVHAVDLRTGQPAWEKPAESALGFDALMGNAVTRQDPLVKWLMLYGAAQSLIFENSTLGSLSADRSQVYAVEDVAIPPHPYHQPLLNHIQNNFPLAYGEKLNAAVFHNKLKAIDLESGKVAWEVGARAVKGDKSELKDSYFLGPPLPLGGKLYVLNEKAQELRLVCLDAARGDLDWVQPLASTRDKLIYDVARRTQAAHLAYSDGILVCPTNAGAVLGVDLLSRSLVWAHTYRGKSVAMTEGGPMFNPNALNSGWRTTAPVIQGGKVVYTPADGDGVLCLNLRDGAQQWRVPRSHDDLYLAGVQRGKVLIVGKNACQALNLADGKPLWKAHTGLPSGQGAVSDRVYYLPLKKKVICALDIDTGAVVAQTESRTADAPGNLLFHEGELVSQTVSAVAVYPRLKAKLAQLDKQIQEKPNDPAGLTERGSLRLSQGDLAGAIADLRMALANRPSQDLLPKTHGKLYEALTQFLQRDFAAGEKHLGEYKELSKMPLPANATAEQRVKAAAEEQRRQLNYHRLIAWGREQQGQLLEALRAYRDLYGLAGHDDLVTVLDDPAVKARPDVWIHSRITALIARAAPAQRKALDEEIAREWKALRSTADTAALARFVGLYGMISPAGQEARLQLAEQLADQQRSLEAENHLLQLIRSDANNSSPTVSPPSSELSARAVETLARLLTRRGRLEDALHYYRMLGHDFAPVTVRDGKTGAEILAELSVDKRFLAYLHEPRSAWGDSRIKATEVRPTLRQVQFPLPLELETLGELPPFFRRHRLVIDIPLARLKLLDTTTGVEQWSQTLPVGKSRNFLYQLLGLGNPALGDNADAFPYQLKGHLAVLALGHQAFGIDLLERKVLWKKDLMEGYAFHEYQLQPDEKGKVWIHYDGWRQMLGLAGPITDSCVCLLTRKGLVAVDPLSGDTLWTRTDVAPHVEAFGDERHLYLAEMRSDGTPGLTRALRARDGVAMDVPSFSAVYQKVQARRRILGRTLLVADNDKDGLRLRLYDVHTGKDLWKKSYPAKSQWIRSHDPYLTGAVDPQGKLSVFDLRTHKEIFTAVVDPKHLNKVEEVYLFQDHRQFYLALNQSNNHPALNPDLWPNVAGGLRTIPINGMLYAFDRTGEQPHWLSPSGLLRRTVRLGEHPAGNFRWFTRMPSQMLIIDHIEELPVLLFTIGNYQGNMGRGERQETISVKSLDKQTGKLLYNKDFYGTGNPFYQLNVDPWSGTIDLVSANLKIRHSPVGRK